MLLPVLSDKLIVGVIAHSVALNCMLGLLDMPLEGLDICTALVDLLKVVLDLVLALLKQFIVLLTLYV